MRNDSIFRLILLAGFVIFMPIGIFHRLKARTGEKLDRRQEGLFILVTLRLVGLAGVAGLIAYFINPACMAWAGVPLPVWLRWTGVGLALIAGLLLVWMFRTLGRNLTDTVVTRKEHSLVTTGPYRWVRHPFYTSAALAVFASSGVVGPPAKIAASNWWNAKNCRTPGSDFGSTVAGRFSTRVRSRYFAVVAVGTAVGVADGVDGVGVLEGVVEVVSPSDGRPPGSFLSPQAASEAVRTAASSTETRPERFKAFSSRWSNVPLKIPADGCSDQPGTGIAGQVERFRP